MVWSQIEDDGGYQRFECEHGIVISVLINEDGEFEEAHVIYLGEKYNLNFDSFKAENEQVWRRKWCGERGVCRECVGVSDQRK